MGWLGTGIMGAPMARQVLGAGHDVTVWNRTAAKAEALAADGATVAASAADAGSGRDVLVTMLSDAEAVEAALDGGAVLDALGADAVWLQTSTVGAEGCERLASLADAHGVAYVDAPVSGTKQPAEQGALVVLGAPSTLRSRVQPLLDAVGQQTVWLDDVGDASRLKLVLNAWLLGMLSALADAVRLAEGLGVDPGVFLDTIDGGPLGPPYARLKGDAMRAGDYPAAFPLSLAAKDARLVQEAARQAGAELGISDAVAALFGRAEDAGLGGADMAAVVEVLRAAGR